MANTTILERVKLALRISHNELNDEIEDVITSARQEMTRAGMKPDIAKSDMELVETAIKTYALAYYAPVKEAEKYTESFRYQLDQLRKTYPAGVKDV